VLRAPALLEGVVGAFVSAQAADGADARPRRPALGVMAHRLQVRRLRFPEVPLRLEGHPTGVPGVAEGVDVAPAPDLPVVDAIDAAGSGRAPRESAAQARRDANQERPRSAAAAPWRSAHRSSVSRNAARNASFSSRVPMVTRRQWARRPPRAWKLRTRMPWRRRASHNSPAPRSVSSHRKFA